MSKRAQIDALFCLEGDEMMDFNEIAEKVGTSVRYVRNVIHDTRSNGGIGRLRRRNYEKGREFDHHRGCRYTEEENKMILGGFKGTDRELAKKTHRSVQALQTKRHFLKEKLQSNEK